MNGLICPKCSTEMNFVTFSTALSCWHLKCRECKEKLRLKKYRRITTIAAGLYGLILGLLLVVFGAILSDMDWKFFIDNLLLYLLICVVVILTGAFFYEVILYRIAKTYDFGLEPR
jgi:hypothetical protein